MILNKFCTITAIIFLFTNIIFAQDYIYESFNFDELPNPHRISLNTEGGYIISGIVDGKLRQTFIDNNGIIFGYKNFSQNFTMFSFDFLRNGDYVNILTDSINETKMFYLQRLSIDFNGSWVIEIKSFPKNLLPQIYVTDDNRIVVYTYDAEKHQLWTSHFTEDGMRVSKDVYNVYFPAKSGSVIDLAFRFGFYYLSIDNYFKKIDIGGGIIWESNDRHYNNAFILDDRTLIMVSDKSVSKYDQLGNKLNELIINSSNTDSLKSTQFSENHELIICSNIGISILDENFNLLVNENLKFNCNDVVYQTDKFITVVGDKILDKQYYSRFAKFPYTGINKPFISLITPAGGEILTGIKTRVYWFSKNINTIQFQYTTNNGVQWNDISNVRITNNDSFSWVFPRISSDECKIKLFDVDNPSISDESHNVFSIYNYNTVDYISGNEIFMWIGNNGMSAHDPVDYDSGLFWPGGDTATIPATFVDGIVWGGKVNGEIRVNGSTYRYGLTPGPIIDNKMAALSSNYTRIFKLKSGWWDLPDGEEKSRYNDDYANWPGQYGAPYEDINWDKQFSPGIDEPKIYGDQTLFYVANDLDEEKTAFTYGSPPIGLEFQQTLFAYNTPELKDAVFKRIKIINKSDNIVDSMFIAYWADDDLGLARDDYIGCDTTLELGYTFNGDNNDDDYYGEAPPALGRVLLQGPIVNSNRLKMTSFVLGTNWYIWDPNLGDYEGTIQFYNYMKGLFDDGRPIPDPNTGEITKFTVAGDPVEGTGWYEGDGWPNGPRPGDHRFTMSTGPFIMQPGDTQEVAFAIFLARGNDNLDSITKLKEKAVELHEFWQQLVEDEIEERRSQIVKEYYLSQNYPNPFNPVTTIEYTIPAMNNPPAGRQGVQCIIYNVLGQKVATLVNEVQPPGRYWVEWNASNFSSGIYFYRITAGNFTQTRKLMLIK
jgi:hypothetical protein